MTARRRVAAALALSGCMRTLPAHLQVEAPAAVAQEDWTSAEGALRTLVNGDPLARHPRFPRDPSALDALGLGGLPFTVSALMDLETGQRDLARGLQELDHITTGGAALARGYRLLLAERALAGGNATLGGQLEAVSLLTPLRPPDFVPPDARDPLPLVFGVEPGPPGLPALRRAADRWVLTGWFDDPRLPLRPVAEALAATTYDELRASPTGQLVLARASGAAGEPDLTSLREATLLALQAAAADRDQEQAAWIRVRDAAAARIGSPDPIRGLLAQAVDTLTPQAGDDLAAAAALVALQAARWHGGCEDDPCGGIDRTSALWQATRLHPGVLPLARVWRVIALKEALDGMEVAVGTVREKAALVDLVDALLGTGATAPDVALFTRATTDPGLWRGLGATVGAPDATTWAEVRVAVGRHLAAIAQEAADDFPGDPHLDRVIRRAVP